MFNNLDENLKNKILHFINMKNCKYYDILKLRLINKHSNEYVLNLFNNLEPTINMYCYNRIPNGCIVCGEVNENYKNIKTNFQSFNPIEVEQTYMYGFLNYCDNAECYFNIKKSQVKIAKCINKANIYCNDILINNNTVIPIDIKRSDNSITSGVEIICKKILWFRNNKILVKWSNNENKFNECDYIHKTRHCKIEEILELNTQLKMNNVLLINPFDRFL